MGCHSHHPSHLARASSSSHNDRIRYYIAIDQGLTQHVQRRIQEIINHVCGYRQGKSWSTVVTPMGRRDWGGGGRGSPGNLMRGNSGERPPQMEQWPSAKGYNGPQVTAQEVSRE